MKISHFISGGITEVVQGLLQAQKAVSLYGVTLKTTGGTAGFSILDFDLAVTTRTSKEGLGEVELSVLGVDLKLGKDLQKSVVSRMKFSVEFAVPSTEFLNFLPAEGQNQINIRFLQCWYNHYFAFTSNLLNHYDKRCQKKHSLKSTREK